MYINSKTIVSLEKIFNKMWISTISFDIYWHWKSDWDILNLTLSDCFNQIKEVNNIFKNEKILCKYVYWVSFSTLAILKFWNEFEQFRYIEY